MITGAVFAAGLCCEGGAFYVIRREFVTLMYESSFLIAETFRCGCAFAQEVVHRKAAVLDAQSGTRLSKIEGINLWDLAWKKTEKYYMIGKERVETSVTVKNNTEE